MVQYGKCWENLMVDLNPSCEKLKERAKRIVCTIMDTHTAGETDGVGAWSSDAALVERILIKHNYDIKKTIKELRNEP